MPHFQKSMYSILTLCTPNTTIRRRGRLLTRRCNTAVVKNSRHQFEPTDLLCCFFICFKMVCFSDFKIAVQNSIELGSQINYMSDCYWQARSQGDCVIVMINLVVTVVIGVWTVRYYMIASAYIRDRIYRIYLGIAIWVVFNLAKNIYSISVFYLVEPTLELDFIYSRIFMVLDIIPSITIQTMFLFIPYSMWVNIMGVLSRMNIPRTIVEHQFLNFFLFYLVIRFVVLLLPIVAILIANLMQGYIQQRQLGFQLFDALMCNLILLFSLKAFRNRFQQIKLPENDKKQLIREYYLMVVWNLLRFIFDLAFLLIVPLASSTTSPCIQPMENHLSFSILYLLTATFLTHFIPMAIILYIYRPLEDLEAPIEDLQD